MINNLFEIVYSLHNLSVPLNITINTFLCSIVPTIELKSGDIITLIENTSVLLKKYPGKKMLK